VKSLRISIYMLLFFSLLGMNTCPPNLRQLSKNCDKNTKVCTVTIDSTRPGCIAAGQQFQDVPFGYTVIWANPIATQYSIQFWQYKTPFHSSSYSGPPVASIPSGPPGQTATGDTECHSGTSAGCYFPYVVYTNGQKCGDPGIHMVN
jgi:hypothetical protein